MSDVNARQVAGTHYRTEYQHWDFVYDTQMPYHLGCATKYLTRWRKKNGVEDLEKAVHYIEKAADLNLRMFNTIKNNQRMMEFIIANVAEPETAPEVHALWFIYRASYEEAIEAIRGIIANAQTAKIG